MRREIKNYLDENMELKRYVRQQPSWYKRLTRNPYDYNQLEVSALHYFKKTIPHQVEKFSYGVQMASMMMSMFSTVSSTEE